MLTCSCRQIYKIGANDQIVCGPGSVFLSDRHSVVNLMREKSKAIILRVQPRFPRKVYLCTKMKMHFFKKLYSKTKEHVNVFTQMPMAPQAEGTSGGEKGWVKIGHCVSLVRKVSLSQVRSSQSQI